MRVLAAMMKHETNTFSPVPTPLARFAAVHGPANRPADPTEADQAQRSHGLVPGSSIGSGRCSSMASMAK